MGMLHQTGSYKDCRF